MEIMSETKSLYAISQNMTALHELLWERQGDLTDEKAAAIIDGFLNENESDTRAKLEGYGRMIRNYEASAELRAVYAKPFVDEGKRLLKLAKSAESKVSQLKARLLWFMQQHELTHLESDTFEFNAPKNPPSVKVECAPAELPVRFQRITIEADKEAIAAEMKSLGVTHLVGIAHLEQGQRLEVK